MNQMNRYPKITAETPIEVVREIHRYIWDYTVEHGKKPDECPYLNACVLCEYACAKSNENVEQRVEYHPLDSMCSCCPADWRTVSDLETCRGIYCDFMLAHEDIVGYFGFDKKAHIARKIRDVVFKTEDIIL